MNDRPSNQNHPAKAFEPSRAPCRNGWQSKTGQNECRILLQLTTVKTKWPETNRWRPIRTCSFHLLHIGYADIKICMSNTMLKAMLSTFSLIPYTERQDRCWWYNKTLFIKKKEKRRRTSLSFRLLLKHKRYENVHRLSCYIHIIGIYLYQCVLHAGSAWCMA